MPLQRPPAFQVASNASPAGGSGGLDSMSRQTSLLPGEVATPADRPTPLVGDWYRADSNLWESKDGGDQSASMTPLNSYGRQDLWKLPADDGDASATTAVAAPGATVMMQDEYGHPATQRRPHQHHRDDDDEVDAAARVQHTLQRALGNVPDGHATSSFQVVSGHNVSHGGAAASHPQPHSQYFFQRPSGATAAVPSQAPPPHPYQYLSQPFSRHQQHPTSPSPPLPQSSTTASGVPTVRFTLMPNSSESTATQIPTSSSSTPPQQHHHQHRTQDSPGASGIGSRQSSSDAASLLSKFRSQSEIISDELYFQAKTFPPPPPPNPPAEGRRVRAELWYLTARKWDITQQLPPPPRSPLPGMEEEHRLKLQPITRVPYRGDRWLAQSQRWFSWIQNAFPYPEENVPVLWDNEDVLSYVA